jgi:hypothetical protein
MQDGTNKVNTVKIKEIYDMSWPPNFDPYRELVLNGSRLKNLSWNN